MKKYFKPLMGENNNFSSSETLANELGVSVIDGFFKEEGNEELDNW